MTSSKGIHKIKEEVKKLYAATSPSHDWSHVERVLRLCVRIGKNEGANLKILKLAALLHDVGRKKQDASDGEIDHASLGANMAQELLEKRNYSEQTIQRVKHCIEAHRFRSDVMPESKEAKILFDADKLDAIGAVGLARGFAFVGEIGAKLYDKEILYNKKIQDTAAYTKKDTAYREFLVKLSKLRDVMLTETGNELAEGRYQFMRTFFERMKKEIKGEK